MNKEQESLECWVAAARSQCSADLGGVNSGLFRKLLLGDALLLSFPFKLPNKLVHVSNGLQFSSVRSFKLRIFSPLRKKTVEVLCSRQNRYFLCVAYKLHVF